MCNQGEIKENIGIKALHNVQALHTTSYPKPSDTHRSRPGRCNSVYSTANPWQAASAADFTQPPDPENPDEDDLLTEEECMKQWKNNIF